ncbi:hypothetical protein OEZ85_004514 [Tetradesmus obliquus]|uniref:RSE1/DDB1/CPSF1 first beta-propeller domain-containing protein n=1 Tax=Tetradesmus obliquus TaxID=3088 RepID=A0ABY8ULF0_TETOB|nr:hypothetical protein OEZ85_004514 [Tetradesmus obliquus]
MTQQQDVSQQAHCYWLATPLVAAGSVISACAVQFRHSGVSDVVLNNGSELHVLSVAPNGRLVTLFKQPVLYQVRDLQVLPFSSSSSSSNSSSRTNADAASKDYPLDQLVALLANGSLAVLRYNSMVNRFMVVSELMLASGNHLDKDHLGCRLAISSDGRSLALAAARGRVACLAVASTAEGVALSEPAVYSPAAAAVAGAVAVDRAREQQLELGSIVDLAFCSCSSSSSSSSDVQHLAAISYRPGESSSELLLLRWQADCQSLTRLGLVTLAHRGPEGVLGRPLHLSAVPSSPTALQLPGQWQQQQQQQRRLELPCWLGKVLLPSAPVALAAGLRAESSGDDAAAFTTPDASPTAAAAAATAARGHHLLQQEVQQAEAAAAAAEAFEAAAEAAAAAAAAAAWAAEDGDDDDGEDLPVTDDTTDDAIFEDIDEDLEDQGAGDEGQAELDVAAVAAAVVAADLRREVRRQQAAAAAGLRAQEADDPTSGSNAQVCGAFW